MPSEVQAQHVGAVAALLEDSDAQVRGLAVEALGRMPAEVQAQHAGAVAALLEDSDANVRRAAVEAFGCMPAEVQLHLQHANAVRWRRCWWIRTCRCGL